MVGSGYREPPALARRADGQTVQLTPLLYAVLTAVDGRRGAAELAEDVSDSTGRDVSPDNVLQLLDKLRPMGLLQSADGDEPELSRSNPLLALRFKVAVSDPEQTRRITAPFARLFTPFLVVPVLATFAWICWWVLFSKGLASATHEAFARPGLLLVVLAVTIFSAGFHEFGHAAATRRGGATPGVMGAGLYLIWPAFYTDVTDSYRLGRVGRLRTDLGGLYFNAIIAVATVGVWLATSYDAILLLVATQILQMLRQLLPLVRFDGYHVLADLTGVPDLFARIGPTLKGLLPWTKKDPAAAALKPWARAVITAWVLTVVPVLAAVLVLLVLTLPRIVGTALAAAERQRQGVLAAAGDGDFIDMAARAVAGIVVLLPVVAIGYLLTRLARQIGGSVWRRTSERPLRRFTAIVTAVAIVAGLILAWWPSEDRYRPIQAYERGTITDAIALARPAGGFAVGSQGRGTVTLPADAELPTRDNPQLAAVLVPVDTDSTDTTSAAVPVPEGDPVEGDPSEGDPSEGDPSEGDPGDDGAGDVAEATDDTWIFPFDEPLAPDEGDTQALAVNTTDGTTTYDVAFALIWADGDQPVDTTNEAYALASCTECAAVAISFQVVLVIEEAATVAPQNIAVAVNYECTSCLTYSLAVQLFVTLDGPLTDAAMRELEALWDEITAYGNDIESVPLGEIQDQLSAFEGQILDIIEADQGPLTPAPSTSESTDPSSSTSPSDPGESPTEPSSTTSSPIDPDDPTPSSGSSTSTEPSASSSSSSTPTPTSTPDPITSDSATALP
ncbi:MAG: hypothetical protein WKF79_08325 [Nocardioides sp.]